MEGTYSEDIIGTFSKVFRSSYARVEGLLNQCKKDDSDKTICKKGEHKIDGEIYEFDGIGQKLKSGFCSSVECFLSQLDPNTITAISGEDKNYGRDETVKHKISNGGKGKDEDEPTHTEWARRIKAEQPFITLRETKEILYYENGVYKFGGETIIEEKAESMIKDCTTHARREIINTIMATTYMERDIFDQNEKIINLKNGLFDIDTGQLSPHSSTYPSMVQLNTDYNPNGNADHFKEFLESILHDEDDRSQVMELFAEALLRNKPNLEKVTMFEGEGHNGKSTLLRTISEVFGEDVIAHVSIHRLVYDRFSGSALEGKLLNIYADIGSGELKGNGIGDFKSFVTGEGVSVEKKNKPMYTLHNFSKMFFSCNRLPEVMEDTDAIYRRFVIIKFVQQFKGDKNNVNLLEQLTTEEEKSGILNILIEKARKIIKTGRLTRELSTSEMRKMWKEKADPVERFLGMYTERGADYVVPKKSLYQAYANFCLNNNHIPRKDRGFGERIKYFGFVDGTTRIDGRVTKVWLGLRLKDGDKNNSGTAAEPTESDKSGKTREKDNSKAEKLESMPVENDTRTLKFMNLFDEMVRAGMGMKRDEIVTEIVKSEIFVEPEANEYLEFLAESGKLVESGGKYYKTGRKFNCHTCNMGPWVHGSVGSGGKNIESFHSGHDLRYAD